jgi:hypothetical protein
LVLEGRHDEVSANARRYVMVAQVHLDIGSQEGESNATQRNAAKMQAIWAGWVDKALEVTGVKEEK